MQRATSWPYIITVRRGTQDTELQFWNVANAREYFEKQVSIEGNIVFASHKGLPFKFEDIR